MDSVKQPNAVSANGTTGCIIRGMKDSVWFRVYDGNGSFTDYDIMHSDLFVTIKDEDAYFYDNNVLDHSPQTLGFTE